MWRLYPTRITTSFFFGTPDLGWNAQIVHFLIINNSKKNLRSEGVSHLLITNQLQSILISASLEPKQVFNVQSFYCDNIEQTFYFKMPCCLQINRCLVHRNCIFEDVDRDNLLSGATTIHEWFTACGVSDFCKLFRRYFFPLCKHTFFGRTFIYQ